MCKRNRLFLLLRLLLLLLYPRSRFLSLFFLALTHTYGHQQVTKKEVFEGGDPHLTFGLVSMQVKKWQRRNEKKKKKKKSRLIKNEEAVVCKLFKWLQLSLSAPQLRVKAGVLAAIRRKRDAGNAKAPQQQSVFISSRPSSPNLASLYPQP